MWNLLHSFGANGQQLYGRTAIDPCKAGERLSLLNPLVCPRTRRVRPHLQAPTVLVYDARARHTMDKPIASKVNRAVQNASTITAAPLCIFRSALHASTSARALLLRPGQLIPRKIYHRIETTLCNCVGTTWLFMHVGILVGSHSIPNLSPSGQLMLPIYIFSTSLMIRCLNFISISGNTTIPIK